MSEPPADLHASIRRLVDFLAGPFSHQALETPGGGQVFLFAQGSAVVDQPRPYP